MEKQLKPNKLAFIASRIFTKIFAVFLIVLGAFIALSFAFSTLYVGIFSFIILLIAIFSIYLLELVVYKKLVYIFYDDKIIQKGGSLFTNYETELNIKNITHLKKRLPWIENKIFKTGHIDIESAGSSASEIHLCSIMEHKEIYSLVVDIMENNGFNLGKGELVSTERPDSLGVFIEVFKSFIVALFVLFYVFSGLYSESKLMGLDFILPIIGLGVLVIFILHIFKFLDLKKRVYKIYKNVITYREGFLSKNYSILPFENLTDSGVTQTFVDKIFGLYDIKISCQGSSHEILFKNIKNGKEMSDKLDVLIADKKEEDKLKPKQNISKQIAKETITQSNIVEENLDYNYDFTKEFRMDYSRTVKFNFIIMLVFAVLATIPFVFWLIFLYLPGFLESPDFLLIFLNVSLLISGTVFAVMFFVHFLGWVSGYIRYRFTVFSVEKKSVRYKYNFLVSSDIEFSADKITGVKISRSFIDKWFNTISVEFWSIGASSSLVFSNIKKEDGIIENIMSKFGIRREDEIFEIYPELSLSEYLKSNLWMLMLSPFIFIGVIISFSVNILLAIGLLVLFVVMFALYYFYNKECYKRTKMAFCKNFVYCQKGWFYRSFYYAKYRDIKDIKTTKYPFSDEGTIKFNVAGDRIVGTGEKERFVSSSFTIEYVIDIKEKDELIDYIFYKRPSKVDIDSISTNNDYLKISEPKILVKPSFKNVIVPLLFILIPLNAMILFLIFIDDVPTSYYVGVSLVVLIINSVLLLCLYLPIKMTTYIMDEYRVLAKSGVIFKKQTSIIYDKIDFINNSQGFLNKVFKNGNIDINTVGSARTELRIKNIPNYLEFYKDLRNRYEGN